MSDTLTLAFEAAARTLTPQQRDIMATNLAQLRDTLATDRRAGRAAVRVPGAGQILPTSAKSPAPGDAPLTAEEERRYLGATSAGRRLLQQRDQADPPPIAADDRELLEQTRLGRSILRQHDAASQSGRYLAADRGARDGGRAVGTDFDSAR